MRDKWFLVLLLLAVSACKAKDDDAAAGDDDDDDTPADCEPGDVEFVEWDQDGETTSTTCVPLPDACTSPETICEEPDCRDALMENCTIDDPATDACSNAQGSYLAMMGCGA